MLHRFLGLPTLLLLLLLLSAQFPMPALCARGRIGHGRRLLARHHLHHLHEPQSNNPNMQMAISNEDTGVIETSQASGHKANVNIQIFGHKADVMRAPISTTNIAHIEVPQQVINRFAPHKAHVAPLSKLSKGARSFVAMSTGQNAMYLASLAEHYVVPSLRRSLVATHVSASHSNHDSQNGKELSLFLAGLNVATTDHNIFGMLPRANRVPPSGPSKSHNSEITEKST